MLVIAVAVPYHWRLETCGGVTSGSDIMNPEHGRGRASEHRTLGGRIEDQSHQLVVVVVRIGEDGNHERLGGDSIAKGQGARGRRVVEARGRVAAGRLVMDRHGPARPDRSNDRDEGESGRLVHHDVRAGKAEDPGRLGHGDGGRCLVVRRLEVVLIAADAGRPAFGPRDGRLDGEREGGAGTDSEGAKLGQGDPSLHGHRDAARGARDKLGSRRSGAAGA